MAKREKNIRFNGPWHIVNAGSTTGYLTSLESHETSESAVNAAQYLTNHERRNGRDTVWTVQYRDSSRYGLNSH